MKFKALDRGELIAIIGGLAFGLSLLLPWYSLGDKYAHLGQCNGPQTTCTGLQTLSIFAIPVLIVAVAPLILSLIVLFDKTLSWPRGELTAVISLIALAIVVFLGIIQKPGAPSGQIHISFGWGLALIGGLLIFTGAVIRTQENTPRSKPPGVF